MMQGRETPSLEPRVAPIKTGPKSTSIQAPCIWPGNSEAVRRDRKPVYKRQVSNAVSTVPQTKDHPQLEFSERTNFSNSPEDPSNERFGQIQNSQKHAAWLDRQKNSAKPNRAPFFQQIAKSHIPWLNNGASLSNLLTSEKQISHADSKSDRHSLHYSLKQKPVSSSKELTIVRFENRKPESRNIAVLQPGTSKFGGNSLQSCIQDRNFDSIEREKTSQHRAHPPAYSQKDTNPRQGDLLAHQALRKEGKENLVGNVINRLLQEASEFDDCNDSIADQQIDSSKQAETCRNSFQSKIEELEASGCQEGMKKLLKKRKLDLDMLEITEILVRTFCQDSSQVVIPRL